MERAEAKEKERLKELTRKRKVKETALRTALRQLDPPIEPGAKWEEVRKLKKRKK